VQVVFGPIHDVKRKAVAYGVDYFVSLLVVVNKFALVSGANIELATVTADARLILVPISRDKVPDSDFFELNFHIQFRLLWVFEF